VSTSVLWKREPSFRSAFVGHDDLVADLVEAPEVERRKCLAVRPAALEVRRGSIPSSRGLQNAKSSAIRFSSACRSPFS